MWCQFNLSWYWDSWQVFYWIIISANRISSVTVFSVYTEDSWKFFSHSSFQISCSCLFLANWMLFQNNIASWVILSSCFHDLCFHDSCIRKQLSILFFYLFNQNRLWRMILMKFFYYYIWFSCSLFIFFSFDQKFKSCEFHVSFHVINQVDKV